MQGKAETELAKFVSKGVAEWISRQTFDKNSSRKLELVFHHRVIGAENA